MTNTTNATISAPARSAGLLRRRSVRHAGTAMVVLVLATSTACSSGDPTATSATVPPATAAPATVPAATTAAPATPPATTAPATVPPATAAPATTPATTAAPATTPATTAPPATAPPATAAPATVCPQNTFVPTVIGYRWLDNGGLAVTVRFPNSCDRPQRAVRGDFGVVYAYDDGSVGEFARRATFSFPDMAFIEPGGTIDWTLQWTRLQIGFDFALSRPAVDVGRLGIDYQFTTETAGAG